MRSKLSTSKALSVTVVTSNRETLQGLEAYLQGAGVAVNGTRNLERLVEMTPPSSVAIILFPDDFPPAVVSIALSTLRQERPKVLPVIVTNEPRKFEPATSQRPERTVPLVIPKPAWAWTILDAVRARLDSDAVADASSVARVSAPRGTRT